jgi:hypothetical protein
VKIWSSATSLQIGRLLERQKLRVQSAQDSLWDDARGKTWRAGVLVVVDGALRAMIVLLLSQTHLQKEEGVLVRAEMEGWMRVSRVRSSKGGSERRRILR